MNTFKTRTFWTDWGFHLVILAVTIPILGLAFLAWTLLPVTGAAPTIAAPPEPARWTASDVIAAFQSADLNAQVVRGETKEERDLFSHLMAIDGHRFRIGDKDGEMGMVLSFNNPRDLARMQNYLLALNRSLPQYSSWLYVKDNILLQINHEVPEHKARAYAEVLETLDW
jgi:hypothetical protein